MQQFFEILKRLRGYRLKLALVVFFNLIYSFFTVVSIPLLIPFFGLLFNQGKPENNSDHIVLSTINEYFISIIENSSRNEALVTVSLVIIGIFFLKNLARYLASYFIIPVRVGFVVDLRRDLYQKYLSLPYAMFPNLKTGDLISRITADIQEIESSILKVIEVIFKSPLVILGSILFMLYVSPELTLFVLVLLSFTIIVIGRISKRLKTKSAHAQSILGRISNNVEETISSIKVIKSFNAESTSKSRFEDLNKDYKKTMTSLMRRHDLSSPLSEFLGISVVMALMFYGAQLVFKQALAPETFFTFILAFYQVIEPAKSLSSAYYSIQKGMAAYERVNEKLSIQGEDHVPPEKRLQLNKTLEISDLSFHYVEGQEILKNINLTINKGESVAIVGSSGSGKTTLVDLIISLLHKQGGGILLDGQRMESYTLNQWRTLFGVVTQSPLLFHDTVRYNITMGYQYTDKEIEHACNIANALEFINELPQGLDTIIGEKGALLSGGQRQRLTIARALLSASEILVLDEATSSLDSESERQVQQALEAASAERTSIIIAHRLSTIVNADKIIIIEDGHIVDQGSHEELLHRNKAYHRMVELQSFHQ